METARGLNKLRVRQKKKWLLPAKLAFPGKLEAKSIVTLLVLYLLLGRTAFIMWRETSAAILWPSADREDPV
jgi:polyferredoxin